MAFHSLYPISACGSITQGARLIPITDALLRTGVDVEGGWWEVLFVQLLSAIVIDAHARLRTYQKCSLRKPIGRHCQ